MKSRENCSQADWVRLFRRESELLIVAQVPLGRSQYRESLDVKFKPKCLKHEGGYYYIDKKDLGSEMAAVREKLGENPQFLSDLADRLELDGNKLLERSSSLLEGVTELSADTLADRFDEYNRAFLSFMPYVWVVFPIERLLAENLRSRIREEFPDLSDESVNEYFSLLAAPPYRESTAVTAQKELYKAAKLMKEQGKEAPATQKAITDLHEKFAWTGALRVGWTYLRGDYEVDHFSTLIQALAKGNPNQQLRALEESKSNVLTRYQRFVKENNPSDELQRIAEMVRRYAFIRTYRGEIVVGTLLKGRVLLHQIATRLGLSLEDVVYCLPDEIIEALEGGLLPDYAARRCGFRLLISNGRTIVEAVTYDASAEIEAVNELTGQGIVSGLVEGKVRVVSSPTGVRLFRDGEILVTQMTSPDMMPAMVRAVAIVTDEGGLTCHAALIARELGIPCVIGTEIATRALHDGEEVQVNSTDGLVTRLSRSV